MSDDQAASASQEESPEPDERWRSFRQEGLAGSYDVPGSGNNFATYGTQTNYQYFHVSGRRVPVVVPLSTSEIADIRSCTVPTLSSGKLAERLPARPVMLLRGRPGSGWRTAAYAALLTWSGDSLGLLGAGVPVGELAVESFEPARGVVLDARDASWYADPDEVLARLANLAGRAGCRIVVLVTEAAVTGDRLVEHDPPDPEQVFRRWLDHRLGSADSWKKHGLDAHRDQLVERLDGCPPGGARDLALDLADGIRGDIAVEKILSTQSRPLRERLRQAITGGVPLGRCLLISSGVLHQLSEATVSRAALRLEALVREQENERNRPGPPVWENLHTLLAYDGLRTRPSAAAGEGRSLWLRPEVRKEVLKVTWDEVPALRGILHQWLHELTDHQDHKVAIRAAQAVAQLAACDFDAVREEFLEPWSERGASGNELIMATLEAAWLDRDLAQRTHLLLRQWSGGNLRRRTSAATAYGSRIGVQAVDEALTAFHQVVRYSRDKRLHDVVAKAVDEVYVGTTAARVLRELRAWMAEDAYGPRRTAALAFVRLARVPEGLRSRPALIGSAEPGDLAALVCHVLDWSVRDPSDPLRGLTRPVWNLLREGVRRPFAPPVVEKVFATLGARDRRLRILSRIHLRVWQAQNIVTSEQCARLRDLLNRGGET